MIPKKKKKNGQRIHLYQILSNLKEYSVEEIGRMYTNHIEEIKPSTLLSNAPSTNIETLLKRRMQEDYRIFFYNALNDSYHEPHKISSELEFDDNDTIEGLLTEITSLPFDESIIANNIGTAIINGAKQFHKERTEQNLSDAYFKEYNSIYESLKTKLFEMQKEI